jgi:hypothetical protein
LSEIPTIEEMPSVPGITASGRGDLSSSRLEEHLHTTLKRLKKLGIRRGACVASVLPDGPDAATIAMAVKLADANFAPLPFRASREKYLTLLLETDPKLLLLLSGAHPAREVAHSLGIPVANVLRHFEAGIFTLEADIVPPWTAKVPLSWKSRGHGVPVVLVAPNPGYRRLANRLHATNPVVGITPPSLEHLPLPHTVEHIAAECVRILRRHRPRGPYALAGWRADGLVALEMARSLEEEGERVIFVAMLDASALFCSRTRSRFGNIIGRALFSRESPLSQNLMGEALRQYHPQPWFGKILHLRPRGQSDSKHLADVRLEWRTIAPQGITSYEAPAEMLTEPNVQIVASILAAELIQASHR